MRKELLNFLGLTQRSYYTWQNHKHPNVIQILNDVFKTKEDILFFNLFELTPQPTYFYNDKKDSKNYREKFCEILQISPSSYHHWQTGKRKNIIKLFRLVFKNPENLEYWLENKKFEIEHQVIDDTLFYFIDNLCDGQKFFKQEDNPLNIGNLLSSPELKYFDIKNPLIYFLLHLDIAEIAENNIKYSIVNGFKIDEYISIDSYIYFLQILDSFDEQELKKIFNKSSLHLNILDSIKRLDVDFFFKLIFLSLSSKRDKLLKSKKDFKLTFFLLDELFDEIKWELKLEIEKDANKNISLRDKKMKLMMEIYKSNCLKYNSCL
ncbi:hypothetical protein PJV93_08140 [Aliarcobacter butzleri]|uniref:HTH cro/C1-type domain-containing protein n=1 Tax=Aliarcobacter butzleri TaxID=28197 RepID=A0AAW7QC45_9BACT|nr:hypothetical protein [Aliarcobacter butzleri]KLD98694.1 hypothetical protein AF74_02465 [Aliarcobacter butzleri L349]MDN5107127.1 hypothetical protein [Aliarcobacter butzleri]MDN5123877.1 hypothetical protein [Aliarcobacter butzleri]